jgi:hypothetical protein
MNMNCKNYKYFAFISYSRKDIYAEMLDATAGYLQEREDDVIRGDLAYGHHKRGELLRQAGDREGALQAMKTAHDLFVKIAASRPGQHSVVYGLATIERALADEWRHHATATDDPIRRRVLASSGLANARGLLLHDKALLYTCNAMVTLAWHRLLAGLTEQAMETAVQAQAFVTDADPGPKQLVLAHVLLLSEHFEAAREAYAHYGDAVMPDGQLWQDAVVQDFSCLRKAGHDHPEMIKIEALLTETPK